MCKHYVGIFFWEEGLKDSRGDHGYCVFQLRNVLHFYNNALIFNILLSPGNQSSNCSDLNYVNAHCIMLNQKSLMHGLSAWWVLVLFLIATCFFIFYFTCCIFLWCTLVLCPSATERTVIYDRNLASPPRCQEGKWGTKSFGWDKSGCGVANGCWSCTQSPLTSCLGN